MAALLLGPPEIHPQSSTAGDASVDFIVSNLNKTTTTYKTVLTKGRSENHLPTGLTENRSPTFPSTGDPCLDFFLHVIPDTPPAALITRLKLAWDHDPLKSLKLVCNLRAVKANGKSNRERFYTGALWLHDHHPKTLAANVAAVADFGYFKDLLELLFRLLEGADARKTAKEMRKKRLIAGRKKLKTGQTLTRQEKRVETAKRVVERFNNDPHFAFLYEQISNLFAQRLRSDMVSLKSGDLKKIGLAAKWCPSLHSSFDRITLLCATIAKKVFPRAEYAEYREIEEVYYAYRVRDRLRKEVLVPLRKALELPEVFIGANDWGALPYNRVASVAMKNYLKMFRKHDTARFRDYLDRVKSGEAKIAAGALLPHQIIAALERAERCSDDSDDDEEYKEMVSAQVAELLLQWKRTVDDVAKNGKFSSWIAICDVSGSMLRTPMEVSVALGILVSELSAVSWKGQLITFSENPELKRVRGESLSERADSVRRMKLGMKTDFKKVFDLFLRIAMRENLMGDEMVKRVFVFSDMEFHRASLRPWKTDYEAIVRKFRERGYGCVPEIVFWNVRNSKATPVARKKPGVTLVNGYSKNLMTVFLENGGVMDPVAVMEAAIAGKEYEKLVLVD